MDERIRVGAVSYLNTRPLVYGLEQISSQVELVFDLPSRLADRLESQHLDVALIPSIEYFQHPEYEIISDACIGCRGPVFSVKLYFRVPPSETKSLALDEGSRTSVALARILLEQRFSIHPALEPLPIGDRLEDAGADAVLLIGDRAIDSHDDDFVEVWDLGEQWCRWSELPFVFAMWTARAGVELSGVELALSQARDAGVKNLPEIAAREAAQVGMTEAACLSYLRDNLYFYLGSHEQRGLALFYEHASRLRLAPAGLDLRSDDCKTT